MSQRAKRERLLLARMEITVEGLDEAIPRHSPALVTADWIEARRRELEAAHGGPLPESPGLAAMEAGLRALPIAAALCVASDGELTRLSGELTEAADLALARASGRGWGGSAEPSTEIEDARALLRRLRGGFVRELERPGSMVLAAAELEDVRKGIDELNGRETEDSARVAVALRAVTYVPALLGAGPVPDAHLARRARVMLMACQVVLEASLDELSKRPTRSPGVN